MWHDLRQSVRSLAKHPGFVGLAALVLALGTGLNIAIFSIVRAMLFEPLPVDAPHELVSIYRIFPRQPKRPVITDGRQYEFFREHNEAFSAITAHWGVSYSLRADDETDVVNASIYALSPCCLSAPQPQTGGKPSPAEAVKAIEEIAKANFGAKAQLAGAAAWSPNPNNPPLFLDLPTKVGQAQPDVVAKWSANADHTAETEYPDRDTYLEHAEPGILGHHRMIGDRGQTGSEES